MNRRGPTMEILPGWKTYAVAATMLTFAVLGLALGHLDGAEFGRMVLEALGLIGLRLGVAKAEL